MKVAVTVIVVLAMIGAGFGIGSLVSANGIGKYDGAANLQKDVDNLKLQVDKLQGQVAQAMSNDKAVAGYGVDITTLKAKVAKLENQLSNVSSDPQATSSASEALGEEAPPGVNEPDVSEEFQAKLEKALELRRKKQEEERALEREKRDEERQTRMLERIDKFGEEKGWDTSVTDDVKNILEENSKKMRELFGQREGRRGPPSREIREQMGKLLEDTQAKLLELMTEEEMNELMRSTMRWGGPRGGGGRGRGR